MADEISKIRLTQNEEMFKQKNEEAERLLGRVLPKNEPISFLCECSDTACTQRIDLRPDKYRDIHSDPRCYVIKPNHQTPAVEDIIKKTQSYTVVRKHMATISE